MTYHYLISVFPSLQVPQKPACVDCLGRYSDRVYSKRTASLQLGAHVLSMQAVYPILILEVIGPTDVSMIGFS